MRVIAGELRGRRLEAPPGETARPTGDRVREAVFNALYSLGVLEDALVVDAFAGTGALGIEALSRGSAHATFVERDRDVRVVLQRNLDALDLTGRGTVLGDDARSFLASRAEPFDVAFLDPPYDFDGWLPLLTELQADLAVLESHQEPEIPPGWDVLRSRRYGGTLVTIIRRRRSK